MVIEIIRFLYNIGVFNRPHAGADIICYIG